MTIKNIKIKDKVNVIIGENIYLGEVLSVNLTPTALKYEVSIERLNTTEFYNESFVFETLNEAINHIENKWGKLK